jgi:hypothetical protein
MKLHIQKHLLFFLIISYFFSACKTVQNPVQQSSQPSNLEASKLVTFQIKSLKAINLQEDITFADEVMMTYSMTILNEKSRITQVVNGSWGVEKIKKNQEIAGNVFKSLNMNVPPKSKVVIALALTEVEDYKKATKLVTDINSFGGLAKIPVEMLEMAEAETPLAVVLLCLKAGEISLKAAEYFDKDDLLGTHKYELSPENIKKLKTPINNTETFQNQKLMDSYEYILNYEIRVR